MRALLIDDNKINRLYHKTLLEKNFLSIRSINEAGTVSEALRLLNEGNYDLILLDMELRDGVGFDILKAAKDFVYVIVITSHKEYAIQAFKHNVVDYILKPVDLNEFKNAVRRVIKLLQKDEFVRHSGANTELPLRIESDNALMVNYKNEYVALDKRDILFIRAMGKHSEIHVMSRSHYMSYKNLKEFERVMPESFVRVHNSYLVNLKSIVSYSRDTSSVRLSNGKDIPVSVRKREELFKKFKLF